MRGKIVKFGHSKKRVLRHPVLKKNKLPVPEVEDFPEDLRGLVNFVREKLPTEIADDFLTDLAVTHYGKLFQSDKARFVADLVNTSKEISRRRKTQYAGALATYGSSLKIEAYNPDKITYKTYKKMSIDPPIKLALGLVKLPIRHVNFSIDTTDDAVNAVVSYILKKNYVGLMRDLLMAIDYGHSFLEKTWKKIKHIRLNKRVTDDSGNVVEEKVYEGPLFMLYPKAIHPSSYTLILDKYGELKYLKQNMGFKEVRVPASRLIRYVYEMEYGNWFGQSRLKPAYKWWYWGEIVFQFMLRYLERVASPPLVVGAPPGYSTDSSGQQVNNFNLALEIGNSMINNSVGVLPQVYDSNGRKLWNMEYLLDDKRIFMFIDVLNFINTMKTRALLVPDAVATQQGSGAFSVSDAHSDIHLMLEESLIQEIEDIINNQIIPDIIKLHFADADSITCRIKIEKLTLTRKQLLKEVFNKMLAVVNQFARDGGMPKSLPDLSKMGDILEIPMSATKDVFNLEQWIPSSGNVSDSKVDDVIKEEKIKETNTRPGADNRDRDRQTRRKKIT